jgi:hypothetical protein
VSLQTKHVDGGRLYAIQRERRPIRKTLADHAPRLLPLVRRNVKKQGNARPGPRSQCYRADNEIPLALRQVFGCLELLIACRQKSSTSAFTAGNALSSCDTAGDGMPCGTHSTQKGWRSV